MTYYLGNADLLVTKLMAISEIDLDWIADCDSHYRCGSLLFYTPNK